MFITVSQNVHEEIAAFDIHIKSRFPVLFCFVCLLCFQQLFFEMFHEHAFHRHWSFVVVNLFFFLTF